MKKIATVLISFVFILSLVGCSANENKNEGKIRIISTIFPQYDFARVIAGDKATVLMLLPPSGESHSFEPSPKDIISVSESDLFIYVGGHSDHWIEEMLEGLDKKPQTLRAFDCVELIGEEGHTGEYDEHIWTTPENAKLISRAICESLCQISPENEEYFKSNLENYINELNGIDREIEEVVKSAKRKTLVFGDKFPFRYFTEKYNLNWYSAYTDCGSEAEPSAKMVAELTDRVIEEKIPAVLHLEFSNKKVAESVAESANVKTMELHSCHNVTKEQLESGISYIDIMRSNIKVLKEVLN